MNNNTAILIFANSAQKEVENKAFGTSIGLFEELNALTVKKVKKAGLPYFLFSEKEQIGSSFGERYTNAIQYVYDQGFENVITVGNDTPHLQTSQLIETANKLKDNPIVLGPSKDGGYYMMGLSRSQFNRDIFLKLPWQTSRLTQSIKRLLRSRKIEVATLKVLSDIDSISDLKYVLNTFGSISVNIKKIILSLITSEKSFFEKVYFTFALFSKEVCFNKGSPEFQLH